MKYRFLFLISLVLLSTVAKASGTNPFDNLQKSEIITAKKAVLNLHKFSADARFVSMVPKEPKKAHDLSGHAKRIITIAMYEPKKNELYELDFDPGTKKITDTRALPGKQPLIAWEEFDELAAIVKKDPCWQNAIKARGYKNLEEFEIDGWAPGLLSEEERATGARLMRGLTFYKGKHRNMYSRPVEGIKMTVDMNQKKVIECKDYEHIPVAEGANDFDMVLAKDQRKGLHPVTLAQAAGASYKLQGQHVQWLNWDFQFKFSVIKGLELFKVGYWDHKKLRSILYKIGLSEMAVPYGDPDKNWSFRNAFDVGEYGLGRTAHSLKAGIDVPSYAKFFSATFSDWKGNPVLVPNAVALYERPTGILWKHADSDKGGIDVRVGQDLVITFMTTVGNYDYGISYVFSLDGKISVEARLTGILLAKGTLFTEVPCDKECFPLAEKQVITPPHQHFFNFRIDFDIDGTQNTPYEMNTAVEEDPKLNPDHNKFFKVNTLLAKEKEAIRDLEPKTARMWKVVNLNSRNSLGHPTGYGIMPEESALAYLGEDSLIRKRARFIEHPIWFTRYKDEEQSAATDYPNQSLPEQGLPQYIADNESLDNQDVVLWYTFGVTHHPRPEEWPIMPVHKTGFSLIPIHFFNQNPSMDLPPPKGK